MKFLIDIVKNYIKRMSRIGWDPNDRDEIRIAKMIWTVCMGFAWPTLLFNSFLCLLFGFPQMALFFFILTLFYGGQLVVFSIWKQGIELHGLASQLVIITAPFIMTILMGGLLKSGGVFLYGVMAPVYALVFPKIERAWFMLFLYFFLAILVGLLDPVLHYVELSRTINLMSFIYNLFVCVMFFFIALYFFVVQRSEAIQLLAAEQERSENLLLNILPEEVATTLKHEKRVIADHYDGTSILFADVVDFTPMTATMKPAEVVELLNEVFSYFDTLVDKYGVEKIKTIGDCYMVAAGVPKAKPDHATALVDMALEMREYVQKHTFGDHRHLSFRIGINSGPVVAGVIGQKKFIYDLWGDTVNTASRMESHGREGAIQITKDTYELVKDEFNCMAMGTVHVKGKGEMEVYHVEGRLA
ncbi:MAG: adenylate/guanylate cyclase domain-containing protein [Sulfurimonadaceae bacterium]|nr:adenylate/guanylate cyclase domain-containing protein [Sulfurimonadaceae bacterium]